METININGVEYIKKEDLKFKAESVDGLDLVLIRTYSAGVHYGYLKKRTGKEVTLVNARRIWKWDGAFTLSEVATKGVSKPQNCKFSCVVPKIVLTEAIEIITITSVAEESLKGVEDYEC